MKTFRRKPLRKASSKAQSAMEYLMTYGWAILIISVVLAALFQLGVFNPMTFAPKAPPGACQVFRPNGPYTTSFINLEGMCSGMLPQYVAQFNPSSSPYITINVPNLPLGASQRTATVWFYVTGLPSSSQYAEYLYGYGVEYSYNAFQPYINNGGYVEINAWYTDQVVAQINTGSWCFLAYQYDGQAQIGSLGCGGGPLTTVASSRTYNTQPSPLIIGAAASGGNIDARYMNGYIANLQIYNTSLSANEIQALYLEGIGGAPIDLRHLVGWWPLNGNANDYSGNGNNGQIHNVNFVSNWYSGYTPP